MAVATHRVRTARGDHVQVTLFTHCGEEPTILISVVDADDSAIPTAEFTLPEAGELRDQLRLFCEQGANPRVRRF